MADLLVSPGPGPGPQLVPIVEYLVVAAPEVISVSILAQHWPDCGLLAPEGQAGEEGDVGVSGGGGHRHGSGGHTHPRPH